MLHQTLNTKVDVIIAGIAFNIERALYKIGRRETNKKATDQLAYENTFEHRLHFMSSQDVFSISEI